MVCARRTNYPTGRVPIQAPAAKRTWVTGYAVSGKLFLGSISLLLDPTSVAVGNPRALIEQALGFPSLRGGRYQRCPAGWLVGRCAMWAPHEQASQTYSSSRPPSNSPQRWCSRIKATKAPRIPGMGWKITTTATPCVGCPTTTNPESLSHSLLRVALFLSRNSRCFRRGHKRHAVCCRRYGRCRWSSRETEVALVARRRHEYPPAPPYDVRTSYRHAGSGGLYRARGAATGRNDSAVARVTPCASAPPLAMNRRIRARPGP